MLFERKYRRKLSCVSLVGLGMLLIVNPEAFGQDKAAQEHSAMKKEHAAASAEHVKMSTEISRMRVANRKALAALAKLQAEIFEHEAELEMHSQEVMEHSHHIVEHDLEIAAHDSGKHKEHDSLLAKHKEIQTGHDAVAKQLKALAADHGDLVNGLLKFASEHLAKFHKHDAK